MTIIVAALLMMAAPTNQDLDWRRPADRAKIATGFGNMANFCAKSFGFTRVPTDGVGLPDKIEAHLLLEPAPDVTAARWFEIFVRARSMERGFADTATIERAADALVAVEKDPGVFEKAQKLYVDTFMGPLNASLRACNDVSMDPFLGKNLLSGTGNADTFEAMGKARFKADVAKRAAERSR